MRKFWGRGFWMSLCLVICACHSSSAIKPEILVAENAANNDTPPPPPVEMSKLVEMSCDTLIEKSKDTSFALKGLAGLRAHKNCKNFRYDFLQLTELEKKLYSDEIDELDPKKAAAAQPISIAELKKNLAAAEKPEDKLKAYKQLRARQKNAGLRNDFLKTTADLFNWAKAEWKKDPKNDEAIARYYEASQLLGKTYWTEGRIPQADRLLTAALRDLKGTTSVAEFYYLKGRMAEEDLDLKDAVSNYDLALEDIRMNAPKSLSFSNDRILWLKSWILYKNKQWDAAEKSFSDLALNTNDGSERSRALFFQARCLNQLDRKAEAKTVFEKIIKDDFFSFYGLVTYNELGLKLPPLSQLKYEKKFPFDQDLSFLSEEEKKIFTDLIRYKEINIAERAVPILAKSIEKQVNLAVYLADNGKRYLPLFASFSKLDNDARVEVFAKYSDLIFPQPYNDNVKKASEKTMLPTSLIYSIMKQESAFNEKTRSSADAIGLMQMIPRLAKHLSKKFQVTDYNRPSDLYDPKVNIQLGSFELMEQVRRQAGQLTFVAAAYNAGPNALAGWLKTRKRDDIVEFIEEIPYDETRTYVKIIARNKLFYERISNRDEEHAFPTEFLTSPTLN